MIGPALLNAFRELRQQTLIILHQKPQKFTNFKSSTAFIFEMSLQKQIKDLENQIADIYLGDGQQDWDVCKQLEQNLADLQKLALEDEKQVADTDKEQDEPNLDDTDLESSDQSEADIDEQNDEAEAEELPAPRLLTPQELKQLSEDSYKAHLKKIPKLCDLEVEPPAKKSHYKPYPTGPPNWRNKRGSSNWRNSIPNWNEQGSSNWYNPGQPNWNGQGSSNWHNSGRDRYHQPLSTKEKEDLKRQITQILVDAIGRISQLWEERKIYANAQTNNQKSITKHSQYAKPKNKFTYLFLKKIWLFQFPQQNLHSHCKS